jgi:type II secretory pathway component PulK
VLIVVLVMLVVLTSLALVMARSARTDATGAAGQLARLQAQAASDAGLVYLRSVVRGQTQVPTDTSIEREAVPVGSGYFWFLKHDRNQQAQLSSVMVNQTFGLNDEAGKLNINAVNGTTLARLPNMTTELAAAIVDWRDGNDEPLASGAESAYYLSLATPYRAKNAPFTTLDELLLVKGFTRQLLYGVDRNRNLIVDQGETDSSLPNTSSIQILGQDLGLADYLTVYGPSNQGGQAGQDGQAGQGNQQSINVNQFGHNGRLRALLLQQIDGARVPVIMDAVNANRPYQNVIDFYFKTGLTLEEFKKIIGRLVTNENPNAGAALVNINSAPKAVIAALGQLTDSDADAIIAQRDTSTGFTDLTPLIEILSREAAVSVGGAFTTASHTVSADIVACDASGRAFYRAWVVMDMQTGAVRYYRNITSLGWPLDPQILADLRAGGLAPSSSPVTSGNLLSRSTGDARISLLEGR